MNILYKSETIECIMENNIIYINTLQDRFNTNDVEPLQNSLAELFKYENGKPYLFSFIFDVTGLSYSTLYSCCKVFSKFFIAKREQWKIHQQVAVCITDKTFLKTVIKPVVALANTGKPFKFVDSKQDGVNFITEKIANNEFDNQEIDIDDNVNLDDMLNEYE